MELREFVHTAIMQIAEGMRSAQKELGTSVSVNPPYEEKFGVRAMSYARKVRPVEKIEFDVWCREVDANTLDFSGRVGTSVGLVIINAQAEGGMERLDGHEGVTHLRFEVNVGWPLGDGLS